MYLSTLSGCFIEVDPLFAEMLGYSTAQEMIAHVRDIGTQFYVQREARAQLLERLLEQGSVCNFETQVYRKDGDVLWVSEYSRVVRGEGGQISCIQGAFANISPYKKLVEAQTRSNVLMAGQISMLAAAVLGRRLPVKDGTRVKFIEISKIKFIRADGDYVHVNTVGGERIMGRDRISNVERRIDSPSFVRISKSLLVNFCWVKEMRSNRRGNYELVLDCGEQLDSGSAYRNNLSKVVAELK